MMKKMQTVNRFIYLVGVGTLAYSFSGVPKWFVNNIVNRENSITKLKEKYGNGWVVVTGGTSGIGHSFVRELSRLGFEKVLIISRDNNRLTELGEELKTDFNVSSKTVQYDFKHSFDLDTVEKLRSEIDSVIGKDHISILVNNVGMQDEIGKNFGKLPLIELKDYLSVNVMSQLIMYNLLGQKMRNQEKNSLIIDVASSLVDIDYLPDNVVYQSTKTFNARFHNQYQRQMKTENYLSGKVGSLDTVLFKPGKTVTNLTYTHRVQHVVSETPDNTVIGCLKDIANGHEETRGGMKHKLIGFFSQFVPEYAKFHLIGIKSYQDNQTGFGMDRNQDRVK